MKRINENVFCAGVLLFALCLPADAQEAKKVPRIGYVTGVADPSQIEGFRQGLRDLGYFEWASPRFNCPKRRDKKLRMGQA